ncbi:MAG: hypothetical protein HY814_06600, partial [Candidatus Riflebacteria bacterium]|nr:hypothetical protein [Candidatus Riflebacteria bacterium]
MSDDVQALVDRSGCPLGTRVNPAVTQKLHRLAAMLLADALGDPLDFLERPASYVRVFYWSGGQQVWLFWLAIDVVFHRVHLQVAGHRTQVLEPLTEPRHRLARKVDLFLQEVGAERL